MAESDVVDKEVTQEAKDTDQGSKDATSDAKASSDGTQDSAEQRPQWPENWREQMAGDDAKALKQLGRYASPSDIWRKARSLEQRLSSGELRTSLPKDATEEQVKEWRKENGLPEEPGGYDLTFEDGLVVGEEDKPIIEDFLKSAHGANYTPAQVKEAVKWYYSFQDKQTQEQAEFDDKVRVDTEDTLRGEWGNDFRGNIQRVHNLLDQAPEGLKDQILNGRLADGTPIGSSPEALRWLVQVSRELNPQSIVVPGAGGNLAAAIQDEIADIEKFMQTNRQEYFKDEKKQARYRELLAARDRQKARAA